MRYIIILILVTNLPFIVQCQTTNDFDVIVEVKSTALKDQQGSGTCWSFATTSFIEAEALRLGKDSLTLSPMFYVTPAYLGKAEKFITTNGKSWFDAGDLTFSVMDGYKKFGAIPEEVFNGIVEGDWRHDQVEMDNLLRVMVESVGTSGYGRIKPNSWRLAIEAVLEAYIGKAPATFIYKQKLYSPISFAREHVGINPDEYMEVTSFTHIDFYKMSVLDIPANWNKKEYLNIPLTDFESVIDYALDNGFTLAWDGDATEPNFDFETGMAKLSNQQEKSIINQEVRQRAFEDGSTTDDHNMHIIGKAKDAANQIYYIMKNSEGSNAMNGYIYMSKNALLLKTISLLIHRDGIPTTILSKL